MFIHIQLAWLILEFARSLFFSMYQFGFFPLTSTACDKSLLNIQEQVLFNINRQLSFRNKLMSSCNLAKCLGRVKKIQQTWKVQILRKIDVSYLYYCM